MPSPREALQVGKIVAIPQLGGLPHRYERIAAWQLLFGSIIGEGQVFSRKQLRRVDVLVTNI